MLRSYLFFFFVLATANARFYQSKTSGQAHNTNFWKSWVKTNHSLATAKFPTTSGGGGYTATGISGGNAGNTSVGVETDDLCIYDLRMHYIDGAPDGVQKRIIGFNGQFPGPVLYCTQGKTMLVRVTNDIKDMDEPTSIHWHGIQQNLSPFYDGPQSITQCPVIRSTSMIYKFSVFQAGTYWYHSHHSYQYVEGAWGLLIVKNSPAECWQNSYDEERLITINDWIHRPAKEISEVYLKQGIFPDTNSSLINGRGTFNCANIEKGQKCNSTMQGPAVVEVTRGKRYRFRILNSSGARTYNFSIDGHKMVVIETDGVDTFKSPAVDVIPILAAQRYSILVTMDQPLDEYWIRISGIPIGSAGLLGRAVLKYTSGATSGNSASDTPNPKPTTRPKGKPNKGRQRRATASATASGSSSSSASSSGTSKTTGVASGRDDPPDGVFQGRPDFQDVPWEDIIVQGGITPDNLEDLDKFFPKKPPKVDEGLQKRLDEAHAQLVKKTKSPTSSPVNPSTASLLDDQQCPPLQFGVDGSAPMKYDRLITINVTDCPITGSPSRMCMNGQPFVPANANERPVLFQLINNQRVRASARPVYTPKNREVIRILINNYHPMPHPWHMHGHSFWVLGTGADQVGPFVPSRDEQKLTKDGVRRDTTFTLGNSWVVFTYITDNPGAWFFHCHINWHLEAGLGMTFIEDETIAKEVYQFPPIESEEVCNNVGVSVY